MSEYNTQYLKQNPLAILNILRDLQKQSTPLLINWSSHQFISRVLDANQQHVIIDYGSQQAENNAALTASNLNVVAETNGAKVEFVIPHLQTINDQGLPAFTFPIPDKLWFIQRREFFRISAPLHPAYYGNVTLPDKQLLRFRLFDLSLGGIGVLLDNPPPVDMVPGMEFPQMELDMGQWGNFSFDVQLLSIGERKLVDHKNETIVIPRLSFRFLKLTTAQERSLQQIIFSLEREAREKANNLR